MKGIPLPFDFEGKGVLELFVGTDYYTSLLSSSSSDPYFHKWDTSQGISVLDNISSPNPPTSTSTLSSSLGGCSRGGGGGGGGSGSTDTAEVATVSGNPSSSKWPPTAQHEGSISINVTSESGCVMSELHPLPPEIGGHGGGHHGTAGDTGLEKCGLGMEDWESVLSDSVAASPSQEQSLLRWIMGDVEDPSLGLNKVLQIGDVSTADLDYNGGFGVVDQGLGLDPVASSAANLMPVMNSALPNSGFPHKLAPNSPSNVASFKISNHQNPFFTSLSNNLGLGNIHQNQPHQHAQYEGSDLKPQVFNLNPQVLINQQQVQQNQNPAFFLPVSYNNNQHEEQHHFMSQQPKRHNSGNLEPNSPVPKVPFLDSGQELFAGRQQQQSFQGIPHYPQQSPSVMARPKMVGDDMGHQQLQQQGIIDQLYKVSELVQSGNPVLAQGILARLNQQLSPIGKPFYRAAYYCKEALQSLLHSNINPPTTASNSPFSLIFKIGAYKSFSEISPFLQFANFTCNQALLEVLDGFDRIHVFDFDIGYGGQWASFMQELALKSGGSPSLKITAFASPSTHDQLELGLTRENLNHFASEIGMAFEFDIVSLDALNSTSWSMPFHVSENEAIAVNLPVGSFFSYQVSLPLVLRFIKHLSPKIVVSVDRGCDRTDLPFPNHVIHVLQSYSNLLESLDAVNVNHDAMQKIEKFLLQPSIEKIVMGRYRALGKTQHWRTLFLSSGFSPLNFSNFTESQAECVVKRTPVQGFHVEKRQSSLVLCWQQRELISASAWRC